MLASHHNIGFSSDNKLFFYCFIKQKHISKKILDVMLPPLKRLRTNQSLEIEVNEDDIQPIRKKIEKNTKNIDLDMEREDEWYLLRALHQDGHAQLLSCNVHQLLP
uniref:Uncharacterized protein n=1 Tax=Lactuca sativa TaxID=4236 RepID=A0A9R1WHD2_LACSA|nr:hypothetical protein LSAT_V11C100048510 [Lactuca sativa]